MNLQLISGARFYVMAVFGVLFIAIFFQNCSPSFISDQSVAASTAGLEAPTK